MKRKPKSEIATARERENLRRYVLPPDGAEPLIKPVSIDENDPREIKVSSGKVVVLSIDMEKIWRESRQHHEIISCLLALLNNMASVAQDAVPVAAEKLGAVKHLRDLESDARTGRGRQAKKVSDEQAKYLRGMQSAVDKLRAEDPDTPVAKFRAKLKKEIPALTWSMVREVKVARARKNF